MAPDYWIVNLLDRVLEVHRDPVPTADAPYGWRYRQLQTLAPDDFVWPLAVPAAPIAVAELLP